MECMPEATKNTIQSVLEGCDIYPQGEKGGYYNHETNYYEVRTVVMEKNQVEILEIKIYNCWKKEQNNKSYFNKKV